MTLDEYIQKLEAAQKVLPDMISVAAKNATIRAVEAAQEKTPPTADSLSGINTRTGELKQHWATDSKIIPEQQAGQYVTELNNNKEYASFVNDGHRMDKHFVPGLYVNPAFGLLEYDPSRKDEVGIMVGTQTQYVEGLHMTDAAQQAYEETLQAELERTGRAGKDSEMNFTVTTIARSLAAHLSPVLPGVQMLEDPAQQGVEPPCMFLQQRYYNIKPHPGGRWLRTIGVDLTYLLDYNLPDLQQQYSAAAETLDLCMEVFPYTDGTDTALLRAYDRKTDIDSDGLHYKFELRIFVEKPEDAVKMQTLSIDQKVDK